MELKLLKICIILFLSLYFCVNKSIPSASTDDSDIDNSLDIFSKFSRFGLLNSCGSSLKSKNTIFGNKFPPKTVTPTNFLNLLLILSGNVELNPGPVKSNKTTRRTRYPCGICSKQCTAKQASVACDACHKWFHQKCLHMNSAVFTS